MEIQPVCPLFILFHPVFEINKTRFTSLNLLLLTFMMKCTLYIHFPFFYACGFALVGSFQALRVFFRMSEHVRKPETVVYAIA